MTTITSKIALPIIIAALFAIVVFVAITYDYLGFGFYITFLLVFIFVFAFGFATGQNFSSPIKKLLQRAQDLSKGDLNTRVYLETKDELGELAKAFNKIAENLQESQSAMQESEKTVGIKVKAKTDILQEKINALEQKVSNKTIELEKMEAESARIKKELEELRAGEKSKV